MRAHEGERAPPSSEPLEERLETFVPGLLAEDQPTDVLAPKGTPQGRERIVDRQRGEDDLDRIGERHQTQVPQAQLEGLPSGRRPPALHIGEVGQECAQARRLRRGHDDAEADQLRPGATRLLLGLQGVGHLGTNEQAAFRFDGRASGDPHEATVDEGGQRAHHLEIRRLRVIDDLSCRVEEIDETEDLLRHWMQTVGQGRRIHRQRQYVPPPRGLALKAAQFVLLAHRLEQECIHRFLDSARSMRHSGHEGELAAPDRQESVERLLAADLIRRRIDDAPFPKQHLTTQDAPAARHLTSDPERAAAPVHRHDLQEVGQCDLSE
ncbi:MAG: hypothetical protein D6729_05720 [Deltaproteobacteria bacterium]|nr:MAG: hypothetical protein D6729_05720 [Deltaproteobacteria bacterium]